MSDPGADKEDELDSAEGQKLASLLKRSMAEPSQPKEGRDILRGVQQKLRQRSRGKFYGDGWSTSNTRMSYTLVAVVMLVILGVAYLALGPVGITPK